MTEGRAQSAHRWGAAACALVLITIGTGAGCSAPSTRTLPPEEPPPRPSGAEMARHEPAFEALRAALDAHDDALAERILERILMRQPDPYTRAYAETFARILKGRALAAELDLFLVASSVASDPRLVTLELCGRQPGDQPLQFQGGAGSLRLLLTGVDELGTEQRASRTLALPDVARLDLPAGSNAVIELGVFMVPPSNSLALLAEWDLQLQPGTIHRGAEQLPANDVRVRGVSTVWRAPWLPTTPIPADSLARYVAEGGRNPSALVERAVRVRLDQREAALDALVPVVLRLPRIELGAMVPSLRWLSGRRELGADLDAWQAWLQARALPEPQVEQPSLELPQTSEELPAIVPSPPSAGAEPPR